MSGDNIEIFTLKVLEWLASDAEVMRTFISTTGISPADIAGLIQSQDFQLAILDFVLQSDQTVLACAEALGCPPERFAQARASLPGGADYHWT